MRDPGNEIGFCSVGICNTGAVTLKWTSVPKRVTARIILSICNLFICLLILNFIIIS